MGHNFLTPGRGQLYLMPPDAREWLPPGHLARALLEQAGQMDLPGFAAYYRADGQGRPAFDPAAMVTLVMYCYCKGIRSSRAIELATSGDVGARVIMGNLHPDHSTVARFAARHREQVKGLLVKSLVACAKEGLARVDVVAGDGTKVKASAPVAANATRGNLEEQIAGLEDLIAAGVAAWIAEAEAADAAGDALPGGDGQDGPGGGGRDGGTRKLAGLTGKLERRQQAVSRLDAGAAAQLEQAEAGRAERTGKLEARAAADRASAEKLAAAADARVAGYQRRAAAKAAAGSRRRPGGRVPVPADEQAHVRRARAAAARAEQELADAEAAPAGPPPRDPGRPPEASTTDPASRVMPGKHGGFLQGCNPQILAGAGQVILAISLHDNASDLQALHPLLKAGRAALDAAGILDKITRALLDAGYASEDNFTTECEAELYVAITKEARQAGRLKDGKARASALPGWQAMTARPDTPDGKALCKRRSAMIEPVFAQLFARLGRDLHYRAAMAETELHLWAATRNLLKAIRAQARKTTAPAKAPRPATAT